MPSRNANKNSDNDKTAKAADSAEEKKTRGERKCQAVALVSVMGKNLPVRCDLPPGHDGPHQRTEGGMVYQWESPVTFAPAPAAE